MHPDCHAKTRPETERTVLIIENRKTIKGNDCIIESINENSNTINDKVSIIKFSDTVVVLIFFN